MSSSLDGSLLWGEEHDAIAVRELVVRELVRRRWLGHHRSVEFPIRPYESVGPIRLGMPLRSARAALAEPLRAMGKGWAITRSFLKDTERDVVPTDDFFDVGFHIYYRIDGERLVVDALEAFEPADLTLDGFPLLKKPYGVVRDFLRGLDPNLEIDDDGAKSSRLGVALYDPSAGEEPERTLASVFIFSRGYWERPLPPIVYGWDWRAPNSGPTE